MAANVLQNYEQLSYGSKGLSMHRAKASQIIGDAVATRTLTAKESGATCLFDVASGVSYTLPPPVPGMEFEFYSSVTITSGAAAIVTDSAATFIQGVVLGASVATATVGGFAFNGTSHVTCSMNGTTTGGIQGTKLKVKALSSTVWQIEGYTIGSGTLATPAA